MMYLLLDGPELNGRYATVEDAFAAGYVFDESTSAAWAEQGEDHVMVYHEVARSLEVERDADSEAAEIVSLVLTGGEW